MKADAATTHFRSNGFPRGRLKEAGLFKVKGCSDSRFSISDSPP